jgi:hypothetical protein
MHTSHLLILTGILFSGLMILGITLAFAKETHLSIPLDARYASLDKAQFSFGITEVQQDHSRIVFTIPENARSLDNQASAVTVSGMYIEQRPHGVNCPVVHSTNVAQTTDSYNPFTGRARVTANFDDPSIAREAYEKACVLIIDVD